MKKRVLLLSEGFGTGHTQAAYALSVSLRRLDPEIQTRVIELGSHFHPTLSRWVFKAYRRTIISQPKLMGMIYRQYDKSFGKFTQLALHRVFYAHTAALIRQIQPNAVVCTHPIPNMIVGRLKRLGLNVPLFTVMTDYDGHGAWINEEVNAFFVPTPDVKEKIKEKGVEEEKIRVTGIPVHPNFWTPSDKNEIRRKYQLGDMPTVLIMGGGWGLFDEQLQMLQHIARWKDRLQLIFCMGNNEKFQCQLLEDEMFRHPNIRIIGFTREIDKWMEVSDLLITKPGGLTCTEAMTKGIPMLFYRPLPGQEEENCQYFVELGYGKQITSLQTIDQAFAELMERYPEWRKRRAEAGQRASTYHPYQCAETILSLLSETSGLNWNVGQKHAETVFINGN